MYAITRLKAAQNAWYWQVNFSRRRQMYSKRFYDLKLGGKAKSLEKAIAWRDRKLKQVEALTFKEFHQRRRSNNTSGVPGVHCFRTAAQPDGVWQAKIKLPDGRMPTKSFSVRQYGERKAFKAAVTARMDMLASLDDRPYLHDETAKRALKAKKL